MNINQSDFDVTNRINTTDPVCVKLEVVRIYRERYARNQAPTLDRAFDDMVAWEQTGTPPAGDDVLTPSVVANSNYGCKFTDNTLGADDSDTNKALRQGAAMAAPCTP